MRIVVARVGAALRLGTNGSGTKDSAKPMQAAYTAAAYTIVRMSPNDVYRFNNS
jgi:hypothetical protein